MMSRNLQLHLMLLRHEIGARELELSDSFFGRGLEDAFILLWELR